MLLSVVYGSQSDVCLLVTLILEVGFFSMLWE